MSRELAKALLISTGGVASLLFIVQGVAWFLLRRNKIALPRWRVVARSALVAAIILSAGGAVSFLSTDPVVRSLGSVALTGGVFNALIATLHLRLVALITAGRRGSTGRTPGSPPRTPE